MEANRKRKNFIQINFLEPSQLQLMNFQIIHTLRERINMKHATTLEHLIDFYIDLV